MGCLTDGTMPMDLLAISDFNLVATHGGFGLASRASGRPKATLSRRVAELELALGVRLFERGAKTLRLTDEGRRLHEKTGGLLAEISEAADEVSNGSAQPRGRLRVSAPVLFSHMAMGRIAAGFAKAYPEVRLEVTAEDRDVDMVEEGYDVAIRVNPAPDELLVGRRFLHDDLLLAAVPTLLPPMADKGEQPPPLAAVVLESFGLRAAWTTVDPAGGRTFAPDPVLRLGTMIMVRDAVLAGAGAGLLPKSLISGDLASGRLVSWGSVSPSETAIWVLYSSRRLLSSKVSAFIAHLHATFPNGTAEELGAMFAG